MCKGLSFSGISVKPDKLLACHRMKRKDLVIMKHECRKQKDHVLSNCKNLQNKSFDLTQLNFFLGSYL